jgi:DNA-directed RNA polymerase subunit RPC12/RpoP
MTMTPGGVPFSSHPSSTTPSPLPFSQPPSLYACAQCSKTYQLTNRDTVRCTKCGYRIMFKLRDKTPVACVAR